MASLDNSLVGIADFIENNGSQGSITILTSGTIIYGDLLNKKDYSTWLSDVVLINNPHYSMLDPLVNEKEVDDGYHYYLYLKNVIIEQSSSANNVFLQAFRVPIAKISGYSIGRAIEYPIPPTILEPS